MKSRPWLIAATILLLLAAASIAPSLMSPRTTTAAPRQSDPSTSSRPSPAATTSPTPSATASHPTPSASPSPPLQFPLTLEDAGTTRPFEPALDEIVRRHPDGTEQTIPLPTQPDFASLRATAAALPAASSGTLLPVFYEPDAHRNSTTRRLATPEIRVELTPGSALPTSIPDNVEVTRPDYAPDFAVLRFPDAFTALDRLALVRSLPGVRRADVLLARQQTRRALPNDPLVTSQWHLKNTGQSSGTVGSDINVESVWNYPASGIRGAGLIVGVVDDGLETSHPDLATNVRTDIDHDWNDSTPNDPSPGPDDDHGTACAGNVAAIGNNNLGVVGSAPEAKIVGLRLIAASTTDSQEAEAMAWRNDLIHVKSNSWGPSDDGRTLEAPGSLTKAAFANAVTTGRSNRGTIILWAGGNGRSSSDNSNNDGYANSIHTIAVGASTNRDAQAPYGEPGANLVVVAPSSGGTLDITTVDRSGSAGYNSASGSAGNYATDFGGTSSSTPTVAGVVALMLQRNPTLGWRDVQEILIKSAAKISPADSDWTTNSGGYRFNHKFGAGLVDAAAAVTAAATWTNLGTPTTALSTQSNSTTIPDNNATGITRTFDLGSSNLRVEHVTLRLNVNHTSRGNLTVTLTSPSGTQSRLTELHSDSGNNYSDWTFMTVRNWSENSSGTWTLKIADRSTAGNSTGGTLTAAELTVFGVTAEPVNPAPVVQLTTPDDQSIFSPGAPIDLAATATDLTIDGQPGVVTGVEFLVNGIPVGSDTTSPYSITYTPPTTGTYTAQARATDSEGAVGNSGTRTFTVANQPPVIASASLSSTDQGFSDEPLSVTDLTASDPESSPVAIAYQWQSSTDGINFTDAISRNTATITATPGHVWRCVLTPSDGEIVGEPFTTAATMILTRPPSTV
ncbi:MAG: S8 family serine peptidase, partial [Chthoniobacterales bacterium]